MQIYKDVLFIFLNKEKTPKYVHMDSETYESSYVRIVYLHVFLNIYLKTPLYNYEQLIRNWQGRNGQGWNNQGEEIRILGTKGGNCVRNTYMQCAKWRPAKDCLALRLL